MVTLCTTPSADKTVSIPQHACWWPITGAASLLVKGTNGVLYQVPDTYDVVPRDYDHALSVPHESQQAIAAGCDEAWPTTIDPKCVVVVRARGWFHEGLPVRCTYWFVRLCSTPQILRRVPATVRARVRTSLLQCAPFTNSTLITEYMDTGVDFCPELQAWARCDEQGMVASSPDELISAPSTASRCVICLERSPQRVLIPCGHAVLCASCGEGQIWSHCPVCRSSVLHVNPLFL